MSDPNLKYTLLMPGLQIPEEVLIHFDRDFRLYHREHPPSPLYVFRSDYADIDRKVLDYYGDCFAFLHDQPGVIVDERDNGIGGQPLLSDQSDSPRIETGYLASIYNVYSHMLDMRLNGSVLFFNQEAFDRKVEIDLSHFLKVRKEIRLYNAALKQNEAYIEFFMYCRVIECLCSGLKKDWIKRAIKKVTNATLEPIYVFQNGMDITENNKIDYLRLMKARCEKRVNMIRSKNIDIGTFYFDEMRNSIAHGTTQIFEFSDATDVNEDCIVLRLLCRFGIQARYQSAMTKMETGDA